MFAPKNAIKNTNQIRGDRQEVIHRNDWLHFCGLFQLKKNKKYFMWFLETKRNQKTFQSTVSEYWLKRPHKSMNLNTYKPRKDP